jgi:hypothetical protein
VKKVLFILLIFVSCGPSEAEIQNRIDEAVLQATSTSIPEEECEEFITSVFEIYENIGIIYDSSFTGEGYDDHLLFLGKRLENLGQLRDPLSKINSRNQNELEILLSVEEYRSFANEEAIQGFKLLMNFVSSDDPQWDNWYELRESVYNSKNLLLIRLNNYKCES